MSPFAAEVTGTMLLIILGDGVVAVLPIPGKGTSDWEYAWIPVVGPIPGGIAGALLHAAIVR